MNIASGRLLFAAEQNHTADALAHINDGADINAQNEFGQSSLLIAARNANLTLVQGILSHDPDPTFIAFLLENGASPNAPARRGETPLLAAVQKGRIDIVRQLLEQGAALNPRDWRGETPLDYALRNRMDEMAHALIELGATAARPLLEWLGYTSETINSPMTVTALHWQKPRETAKSDVFIC